MRTFPDHITECLRRRGVDPALLEPGKVDADVWRGESGRWCVARLADGRGVVALSVGPDPKGTDKDTYVTVLPLGGEPTPEDIKTFERLSPGAGRELQYAVADLSRMVPVKLPDIAAAPVEAQGDLPAGSGRIDLLTDRPTVLVFWGPPTVGGEGERELVAPEVLRLALDRGWRDIDIPNGAAWGALFDPAVPAGEPPLIIGAFRVTGGEQRLYTVLRFPLPGTKQRLYLEGVGVMKPLTPAEFARITGTLRAAGLRWDPNLPYAPPFQLWWGHKGRPESTVAPSTPSLPPECLPEVAPPEVPKPLRFVYEDVEYGKRGSRACARFYVPLERLIQYGHEVHEFPTLKVVAHAPGAREHPERLNIPAPTRWVIGTAPDGSRLIVLALHDPISDADRVVDLLELPAGAAYGEWIGVHFERWYPGAGEEIALALAAAERRAEWPFASPEAAPGAPAPPAAGAGSAAASRIHLKTILPTVLVLWGPPTLGEKCELAAPEVQRLSLDSGEHDIDIPSGAAWGGLYDPSRDPPLLIGAFRACGGAQGLYVVRYPGLRVMKSLYLKGDGALDFQNPGEYDEVANYMRAAGLRWDSQPYTPPFQLWWELVGHIECPGGDVAPNPEQAATEATEVERARVEGPTAGAPGGETTGASETSVISGTASGEAAPPAPEAQEPRAPGGTPGAAPENSQACSQPEPAGAGRIDLMTDRPTVLVLWGPPTLGEKCELAAPEVQRLSLDSGEHDIDIPSGAAWGGLYDPSRDPPLLIGAFRACGGAQGLYVVRYPGLRVMKSLYLKGDGALDFQNPGEYDEVANYMRAAGLRWDSQPYTPPFQLWWELVGHIECPGGDVAPNPEQAATEATEVERARVEGPTAGAPGGETTGASETSVISGTASGEAAPPAPEVQVPRAPPGPAAGSGEGRGQWTLDRWLSGEGVEP